MSLRSLRPVFGLGADSSRLVISHRPASSTSRHFLRCAYTTASAQPPVDHSRHDRPFRMAVVGSGPAGFYTAYRVMSLIDNAKVDMYEALPVPYGLVRFGVAPDHPEVKVCCTHVQFLVLQQRYLLTTTNTRIVNKSLSRSRLHHISPSSAMSPLVLSLSILPASPYSYKL